MGTYLAVLGQHICAYTHNHEHKLKKMSAGPNNQKKSPTFPEKTSLCSTVRKKKFQHLRAYRHLESFEPDTAYIYKFSLLVSVICVTFAQLHT